MFISKYEPYIYTVLRIVSGFLFLWHGSQKLFDFPHSEHEMPMYLIWIAGPVELIGGFLIMIGLWTRFAAFISCGEMAVAYWIVHGSKEILPILNKGELSLLFCFIFMYLSVKGSGIFSIDNYLNNKKEELRMSK